MASIIQAMRYGLSFIPYDEKFSVAEAAVKYKTPVRLPLEMSP